MFQVFTEISSVDPPSFAFMGEGGRGDGHMKKILLLLLIPASNYFMKADVLTTDKRHC